MDVDFTNGESSPNTGKGILDVDWKANDDGKPPSVSGGSSLGSSSTVAVAPTLPPAPPATVSSERSTPEPSILDVDWEHESFEPISEHSRYHPLKGPVPEVPHPDNVLDADPHPDFRSDLYGGQTSDRTYGGDTSLERAQRAYREITR